MINKLLKLSAIWLTLEVPFILTIDGQETKIRPEEFNKYHGGYTIVHKCSHCGKGDMIDFSIKGNIINLDDLSRLDK